MMRMAALAADAGDCIDLTLGEPDLPTPRDICQKLAEAAFSGDTHYTPGMGRPELRKAIAGYWRRGCGLDYGID